MNIKVEKLHKSYRDADRELVVLGHLDCELPGGQTIAIVGRSGVGKSTLLHLLGGLDRPTSGRIWYGETEITALNQEELAAYRGREIGFVFQFHHLLPEFNARENVSMPLLISGMSDDEAGQCAQAVLEQVRLAGRADHRPSELSGGEQQRVAVARALVTKPDVILADEPTGNLDLETAQEVRQLLLEINRSQQTTIIIVTHSQELAGALDLRYEMMPGGALQAR